jgi:hypothetical protein
VVILLCVPAVYLEIISFCMNYLRRVVIVLSVRAILRMSNCVSTPVPKPNCNFTLKLYDFTLTILEQAIGMSHR